jgi:hypothetical protein
MSLGTPIIKEGMPFPLVTAPKGDGKSEVLMVQKGFKNLIEIKSLLKTPENPGEGYSKCLFVSLPGAFTPT